jgi:hypothetical protein
MPDFNTSIEVEPWEYIQSCSEREIKNLITELSSEGYLPDNYMISEEEKGVVDIEWENACLKLLKKRHLLSVQDENTILEISKKIF